MFEALALILLARESTLLLLLLLITYLEEEEKIARRIAGILQEGDYHPAGALSLNGANGTSDCIPEQIDSF